MPEGSSARRGVSGNDDTMLHVIYGLYALSYLTGFTLLFGVILAYFQRGSALIARQQDHIDWLIRTFWWSVLFGLLILTTPFILGFILGELLFVVAIVWFAYRIIKGWDFLYQDRTLEDPRALI